MAKENAPGIEVSTSVLISESHCKCEAWAEE